MMSELPPNERPPAEQAPPPPPRRSWEEEKEAEKEAEKEQEKEQEKDTEKSSYYGEKFRRDPLSAVFWAAIFILAGIVLLAENMGWLPTLGEAEPWQWIMLGAGGLLLIEALIRATSPDYARPTTGRFILAVILIGVGAAGIFAIELTWPLILIVVGVAILLRTIIR
jgi:hypothetical protein